MNMKKLIYGILTASLIAGVLTLSGCKKDEPGKNNGGGDDATLSGVYTMSQKPLYSDLNAADPDAKAIETETINMTYAQLIMAAYAFLPTVEINQNPLEITFNADGTMKIVDKDPVDGDDTVFPDADGFSSRDITYSVNGNDFVLSISSEVIDGYLNAEDEGPEFTGAVKAILTKFNKGIVVYSAASNTAKINLRYTLNGRELSVYVDQPLVRETWDAAQGAMADIEALIGEYDPTLLPLLNALIPQVDGMLKTGLTKIEVGVRLTKK